MFSVDIPYNRKIVYQKAPCAARQQLSVSVPEWPSRGREGWAWHGEAVRRAGLYCGDSQGFIRPGNYSNIGWIKLLTVSCWAALFWLVHQGMDAAMQDFSKREEHEQSDSCFVVFMSHGNASGLCGVFHLNDKEKDIFNTDKIFENLYTQNCAGLRDKPKIILIQSCRGGE